jgi:hypothetical protein
LTVSNAISSRIAASGSNGRLPNADSSSSIDLSDQADPPGTRFGLRGPSLPLDPRIHAYRRDIADVALAGHVISSHYARALQRACGTRATLVWPSASAEGDAVSELLPGEGFAVLEYTGAWAWGYCTADHRVGYVEAIELIDPVPATHVVCEAKVPVFADGRIGAVKLASMPMGARLTGHEEGACLMSEVGCVPMSHVRRTGEYEEDAAAVAMRLIGSRYLPGGRSHNGIDAAGLIQLALAQCGVKVPRDLSMQQDVGLDIPPGKPLRRGDLVFAGAEGGVMLDDLMLIHASAAAGKVTVEPVAKVEARAAGVRRRVEL